ncbi:MAG: MarR family transcriptional regulator [Myxococcaceae bacterium]|nr:MarR family transcriptional regulator [Myxococcaceae bacterium]
MHVRGMAKVPKEASEAAELMGELYQEHKRAFQATAKEHGLTMQQMAALFYLTPDQGVAMSALADLLMCDASNVTGIVDKLEARGLARRGQAEDRRVKVLTLTEQGEALRTETRQRMSEPAPWLLKLSRDDQRNLRDILRRAVEAARVDSDGEGKP